MWNENTGPIRYLVDPNALTLIEGNGPNDIPVTEPLLELYSPDSIVEPDESIVNLLVNSPFNVTVSVFFDIDENEEGKSYVAKAYVASNHKYVVAAREANKRLVKEGKKPITITVF